MIRTRRDDTNPEKPKLIADIDNGDLIAIERLMDKYNFLNEESLIRFAFATLLEAEDSTVYVKKGDDTIALKPTEKLLKPANRDTE